MKKLAVLGTLLFASSIAMADFQPANNTGSTGGFKSDATAVISVAKAKSTADKSVVTLQGKIVKQVDEDEYIFTDGTAEMKVEIDQHIWRGVDVNSQNTLRITGIIDNDVMEKTTLDVTEVVKLD